MKESDHARRTILGLLQLFFVTVLWWFTILYHDNQKIDQWGCYVRLTKANLPFFVMAKIVGYVGKAEIAQQLVELVIEDGGRAIAAQTLQQ